MVAKLRIADRPWLINLTGLILVLAHALVTRQGIVPDIWHDLAASDPAQQAGIYLGFMGAAAIVSGFAGVVVVFGLSATSKRFRQFRVAGGRSLARNWTSTSASGLLGAGLSLIAAILVYGTHHHGAVWLLELAIVLVTHSSIRLVWLLRGMVGIVKSDDIVWLRDENTRQANEHPWNKQAS